MKIPNISTLLSILWLSVISQAVCSQHTSQKPGFVNKELTVYATSYKTNERLSLIDTV